jgi:hypothetical protein
MDGKRKDEKTEDGGQKTKLRDGWMIRMNGWKTGGRRTEGRGHPSEMRCARHGHEFHGVKRNCYGIK